MFVFYLFICNHIQELICFVLKWVNFAANVWFVELLLVFFELFILYNFHNNGPLLFVFSHVHGFGPAVRSMLEVYHLKPDDIIATGPHGGLLKG